MRNNMSDANKIMLSRLNKIVRMAEQLQTDPLGDNKVVLSKVGRAIMFMIDDSERFAELEVKDLEIMFREELKRMEPEEAKSLSF